MECAYWPSKGIHRGCWRPWRVAFSPPQKTEWEVGWSQTLNCHHQITRGMFRLHNKWNSQLLLEKLNRPWLVQNMQELGWGSCWSSWVKIWVTPPMWGRTTLWGRYRKPPDTRFLAQRRFFPQKGRGHPTAKAGTAARKQEQLLLMDRVLRRQRGQSVLGRVGKILIGHASQTMNFNSRTLMFCLKNESVAK